MKISGVIIAFNEEKNIRRCIESMLPLVDEIIVVDSFSNDKTVSIAEDLGAKVTQQHFLGHIEQKNFAMSLASHFYILSLDADEEISASLKQSIKTIKNSGVHAKAYSMNRLTQYIDQWIRHCDWYPDQKIRLWHKDHGKWSGQNPHDKIELKLNTKVEHLNGDILHYSYQSITDHVQQTNYFTTIAAKAAFDQGTRSSIFKIVTRPFLKFLKDYFLRAGFLEGKYGFIICYINALSAFLKYSKIHELQNGREI
jgi:glycosyltransferase involved in cell wall biosynthesis